MVRPFLYAIIESLKNVGVNVYSYSKSEDSDLSLDTIQEITTIQDLLHPQDIPLYNPDRYQNRWTFPSDFALKQTLGGTKLGVVGDGTGTIKMFEYEFLAQMHAIARWSITLTKEGSLIYHGPVDDERGQITILVPMHWKISVIDNVVYIVQAVFTTVASWIDISQSDRQVFKVVMSNGRVITQETMWDSDTAEPYIRTSFTGEHLHRYDVKHYASLWHQSTSKMDYMWRYSQIPILFGADRITSQMSAAFETIDILKELYEATPEIFDKFRNPYLVP